MHDNGGEDVMFANKDTSHPFDRISRGEQHNAHDIAYSNRSQSDNSSLSDQASFH